ncbi:hypothetical protein HF883_10165 [Cloacibacillus porcorum]|uniref:hypothetical protein n=1 Tax=Cloacibacillus porcorum TaxID=1197717 RepID=UPI001459D356|nr:hypothetical protein [Cloacibacillus porcorum]NMF18585.1 hypothetical protein [Cloacibacillus porcorum]
MAKRTDKEYEERYQALLKEHGLERKQSDFEKDIAEYRAKTEDKGTPKHGTQPGEGEYGDEITVRTTKAGAATAEVNTEAVKKNKKAKEVKKQSVTDKKAPSTTPVEAPKTKKRISNTSEKTAPTPQKGYEPENQDVRGINRSPLRIAIDSQNRAQLIKNKRAYPTSLGISNYLRTPRKKKPRKA